MHLEINTLIASFFAFQNLLISLLEHFYKTLELINKFNEMLIIV